MASRDKNGEVYGKGRSRNFVTVVYPESAPENWRETLGGECVPAFISPLHDSDVNADGAPKKAHWHVMLMFDTVKTQAQAGEICASIGGVGCQRVSSIRSMARYLCHLDNPDKHQYAPEHVVQLGGADYIGTIGLASDKYKAIREIIAHCRETGIICYADLLEYAAVNREDWFRVLCDNGTVVVAHYLKSATWRMERAIK